MGYLSWKAKTKHFVKRKECFYPPIDDPKIAYFLHLQRVDHDLCGKCSCDHK